MMGEPEHPGITPLAVDHIFKYIEDHPEREFVVGFSYFEIYNEKVRDLLKERAPADVRIKFSQKTATSAQFLTNTIIAAESNRATGSTSMNEHSSRSHAIVRIAVDSYQKGDDGVKLSSILNLVDLAGSECQKNTNAEGDRQHEASMINKSLLALSKLIDSLQNGKSIAVYRESKLTLYLQNSIGGNAQTTIICAINSEMNQKGTSEYTLRFASKAMKIKNQPKVNRIMTDKCKIEELERENRMLKQKLAEYEERMIDFEQKGSSCAASPAVAMPPSPAMRLPTWPTPTIPRVRPASGLSRFICSNSRTECRYCATEGALQPGALAHCMPAWRQYSVSMWSKPMVAVAMKRTLLPSSKWRSQRVRVRMMSASASFTSSGVNS